MVRPPCCDKLGVKKGPWTPEEDIILVSYINQHGPGNWRLVPVNTGLQRCSKSCRLRYTNYLRPNIRRGNFTEQEDTMIIHLQALLGNRPEYVCIEFCDSSEKDCVSSICIGWAAIASYLPQRTDNDIKNYWNTHLRKKLQKIQGLGEGKSQDGGSSRPYHANISKGQWERRIQTDIHTAKQALCEALSLDKSTKLSDLRPLANVCLKAEIQPPMYASSTENLAKLLPNWMKESPKSSQTSSQSSTTQMAVNNRSEGFEPLFSFGSSNSDGSHSISVNDYNANIFTPESNLFQGGESKAVLDQGGENQVPFPMLENWWFDDGFNLPKNGVTQGQEGLMDMPFSGGLF